MKKVLVSLIAVLGLVAAPVSAQAFNELDLILGWMVIDQMHFPTSGVLKYRFQKHQADFEKLKNKILKDCPKWTIYNSDFNLHDQLEGIDTPAYKKLMDKIKAEISVSTDEKCKNVNIVADSQGFVWTDGRSRGYVYSPDETPKGYCGTARGKYFEKLMEDIDFPLYECPEERASSSVRYQKIAGGWYIYERYTGD